MSSYKHALNKFVPFFVLAMLYKYAYQTYSAKLSLKNYNFLKFKLYFQFLSESYVIFNFIYN